MKLIYFPKADARTFSLYFLGKFLTILKDESDTVCKTALAACKSVVNLILSFTETERAPFVFVTNFKNLLVKFPVFRHYLECFVVSKFSFCNGLAATQAAGLKFK